MRNRSSNPLWIATYLLTVFLSGALVGAFGHRLYSAKGVSAAKPNVSSHDAARQRYVLEMQTRLHLDDGQKASLIGVLDDFRQRYRTAREKIEPEMKQIQSEQRDKIRGLLREDQRGEYEKMLQEMDRRRQRDNSGRGGGF